MGEFTRRDFVKISAAGATASALGALNAAPADAQTRGAAERGLHVPRPTGDQKYDLLIQGGEVIDPGQSLRGKRDIAIFHGRISAVEAQIPADKAKAVIAAAGKLVLPGLVDMHAHVYPQATAAGLPPDELVPFAATTTYVDAGTAGASNFSGFHHWVINQNRTRIFAFLNISSIGLAGVPIGELLNIDYADVELAAKTLAENAGLLLGIKVRESDIKNNRGLNIVGDNGLEPLRRAIKAAEMSGVPGARVMCHIGGAPGKLSDLLDLLRPGDVLTHSYSGAGNNVVDTNGKLVPGALEAKKRGVHIDVGHGGSSFNFRIAEAAIKQGLTPDSISSDVWTASVNTPGMPFLPWVMSKFLALGLPLEKVVELATVAPAKVIGRVPGLGTLQPGAPADISIVELVEGSVKLVDTQKNEITGKAYLKPFETVRAGVPFGRPYPLPFSVPA